MIGPALGAKVSATSMSRRIKNAANRDPAVVECDVADAGFMDGKIMNKALVHNLFLVLLIIGLVVTLWGVVGPNAEGAASSDVFVEELDLPREPEVYLKVSRLYTSMARRSYFMTIALGLFIAIPAGVGCWETREGSVFATGTRRH
jgi:hypothetical protein